MRPLRGLRRRRPNAPPHLAPPGQHPRRDEWLAADPRRQVGEEVIYGSGWIFDDPGDPYSLIWNPGRGELYTHRHRGDTIAVIATIATRGEIDTLLDGWEQLHDEPFGGYMVCSRVADHNAQHRSPEVPCFGVVLRVDGTAEPVDRPLTYHDIQGLLGGVALTTADAQQPVVADPLVAQFANAIHLDRNAHRDHKPVNDAATSLRGGRWPIRGDVVITGHDPRHPLDRLTVDMLLRLPRPPVASAVQERPRTEIATIPHSDWLQADPRRRAGSEIGLWRDGVAFEDPNFLVTFNDGSHELYLWARRRDAIAALGVFDNIGAAQAVVRHWDPHRLPGDDRFEFERLLADASRASIPIDRDVDHDLALAVHADVVATEHDCTVRFDAGRHRPVRFRFERPGVGTHLGRSFTVTGPYVEPAELADIDTALTDFVDNWSPDNVELDPDWAQAEADYIADGREWMREQLDGEGEPDYIADEELGWVPPPLGGEKDPGPVDELPDPVTPPDPTDDRADQQHDSPAATTPQPAASPADEILTDWGHNRVPAVDIDRDVGLGGVG